MNYSDEELLHMMQSPDEKIFLQGFNILYKGYAGTLHAAALRILKDEAQANDVIQDAFERISRDRTRLATVANFEAYYKKTVINLALQHLKKKKRDDAVELEFWDRQDQNQTDHAAGETNGPLDLLLSLIDQLPPQQRLVYVLAKIDRVRYAEISTQLCLSVDTVKHYVFHANKTLKRVAKGWRP